MIIHQFYNLILRMEIKKLSYMHFFYIKQSDTTAFYHGTNKILYGIFRIIHFLWVKEFESLWREYSRNLKAYQHSFLNDLHCFLHSFWLQHVYHKRWAHWIEEYPNKYQLWTAWERKGWDPSLAWLPYRLTEVRSSQEGSPWTYGHNLAFFPSASDMP